MMSNECPLPPPPVVMDAVMDALRDGNLYPNTAWELRDALAERNGVPAAERDAGERVHGGHRRRGPGAHRGR